MFLTKATRRTKKTKKILATAILSVSVTLIAALPAQAGDIILSTASYDSPDGYDFVNTSPPTGSITIGTYNFTIPPDAAVTGITISGTFGNGDVPNTALSDYYLGFSGDETAIPVANCDSDSDNCYSGQEGPYAWSATLTQAEIADLAPALTGGSIDFTYTWDQSPPAQPTPDFLSPTGYDDQYVYAGATSLDISYSPEPATVLFCFSGIGGIIALRRFRKH